MIYIVEILENTATQQIKDVVITHSPAVARLAKEHYEALGFTVNASKTTSSTLARLAKEHYAALGFAV